MLPGWARAVTLAVMLQAWSSGILKVLSVTKVYIYILKACK